MPIISVNSDLMDNVYGAGDDRFKDNLINNADEKTKRGGIGYGKEPQKPRTW